MYWRSFTSAWPFAQGSMLLLRADIPKGTKLIFEHGPLGISLNRTELKAKGGCDVMLWTIVMHTYKKPFSQPE